MQNCSFQQNSFNIVGVSFNNGHMNRPTNFSWGIALREKTKLFKSFHPIRINRLAVKLQHLLGSRQSSLCLSRVWQLVGLAVSMLSFLSLPSKIRQTILKRETWLVLDNERSREKTHLCFWISWIPPRWYPNRSEGLSLQSFLIKAVALRVMFLGNSIASIPFKMMLYVLIGSGPVNGGVPLNKNEEKIKKLKIKRWLKTLTRQKLKHQHSQRPIISTYVMTTIQDNLGSNVLCELNVLSKIKEFCYKPTLFAYPAFHRKSKF